MNFTEKQVVDLGNSLSKVLKNLRIQAQISQNELAWRSGLSQQHIGYLEKGQRLPSALTLKRLALALGYRLSVIIEMAESSDELKLD